MKEQPKAIRKFMLKKRHNEYGFLSIGRRKTGSYKRKDVFKVYGKKHDWPFSTACGCELNREKDNLYSQIIDLQKAEQAEMRRHLTKYGQTDHTLFIIGIGRLR